MLGQLLFKCNLLHITYYFQLKYLVTVTCYPYNKVTMIAKNTALKNQLRNFLRDENHLYVIILVHLTSNVALKTRKHSLAAGYRIFLNRQTRNFVSLTHSLTTVASLEPKRSSAWSPFYATTTNSPVGCAFWGSDECAPCTPCLFFYLQSVCLSSSSSNETITRR